MTASVKEVIVRRARASERVRTVLTSAIMKCSKDQLGIKLERSMAEIIALSHSPSTAVRALRDQLSIARTGRTGLLSEDEQVRLLALRWVTKVFRTWMCRRC